MNLNDVYTLNDGNKIPIIGFGTWKMGDDQTTIDIVKHAIDIGYRHIDTASMYGNEKSIGKAIKESDVVREELFVTTKLGNEDHNYERARSAINKSLELLDLEYLDLYLIHWPNPLQNRDNWKKANAETWRAMEDAQKEGKIKSLGISNFMPRHTEALLETATTKPAVNQILLNPSEMQPEVVSMNKKHDILSEAYSPLGTGKIFEIDELNELARKYDKTPAQVVLRWSLQHEFLPLPKTVTFERVEENANIFDFEISAEDMKLIDSLKGRAGKMENPDEKAF